MHWLEAATEVGIARPPAEAFAFAAAEQRAGQRIEARTQHDPGGLGRPLHGHHVRAQGKRCCG